MLNGHTQLEWKGELFHSLHENPTAQHSNYNPFELLEDLLAEVKCKNFGFETKFQHLDSNGLNIELVDYLVRLGRLGFNKYVLLSRRNYLRQAISVARGQVTKTWHVPVEREQPVFPMFELDLERISLGGANRPIVECFEFLDDAYQEAFCVFRSIGLEYLHLIYEDDLELDPAVGFQKALSFFELPHIQCSASLRKLEKRPIAEIISNFSELSDRLKNTPYQWMCE